MTEEPPDDDHIPIAEPPPGLTAIKGGRAQRARRPSRTGVAAALRTTRDGDPLNTLENTILVLEGDAEFAGKIAWNVMAAAPELAGEPMLDATFTYVRRRIEQGYGFAPGKDTTCDAIDFVARANAYHPVLRYLKGLTWDGKARIADVLSRVLGVNVAALSPQALALYHAMIRKWFIGAVARVYVPGCKCDTMLILQGKQGARKSSFFDTLGGEYFVDTKLALDKDAFMLLARAWIVEFAELDTFSKASQNAVKAFMSSRRDAFRSPYGRAMQIVPRAVVLAGTTNSESFLRDPTGERRFWPIPVASVNVELLAEWRDQLWAEAVQLFATSEGDDHRWWLSPDEDALREADAKQFEEPDPWETPAGQWAAKRLHLPFTTHDALVGIGMDSADMTRTHDVRMSDVLRKLGYLKDQHQRRRRGTRERFWRSPDYPAPAEEDS